MHFLIQRTVLLQVLMLTNVCQGTEAGQSKSGIPVRDATSATARQQSWSRHVKLQQESVFKDLKWRSIGPRMQGGRIECIACPPGNTSVMYVGVGSGSLWKTENKGITWKPIFEKESTFAMGDVAVSQSNPKVVWVGTGEVLMARSSFPGMGVFKSTDAGKTWKNMGLVDTHHIGKVIIHPKRSDVVYVAAIGHMSTPNKQRGVLKTTDGGRTWKKSLYVDEESGAIDLVMDQTNPEILYATTWHRDRKAGLRGKGSGVYKTTNGGKTWQQLTNGLPVGKSVGRIAIALAPSNPKILYALVDTQKGDGLYRSEDQGETWKKVNKDAVRAQWDWCEIHVSPDDPDEIYNIGQRSYVSKDGGRTFRQIGGTIVHLLRHNARTLHLDTHAMWIDPLNPNRIVFGNDGGLFFSYDRGKNWLHVNNLPIAECYAVTYDMAKPYNVYIGTQDNAALFGPSTHTPKDGYPDEWKHVYLDPWGGGDSYFTYRDPSDPNVIYYEHQFGELRRKNMKSGKTKRIKPNSPKGQPRVRCAWMTPYFISRYDSSTLYYGANRVYKSKNRGDRWRVISPDLTEGSNVRNVRYRAITTMAESPLKRGLLYAGTDNANLYITEDDGKTWKKITKGLPPHTFTRVHPSPHEASTVFVTLTGMRNDDFSAYIFRSNDKGATWKAITSNLPLESVNVIYEDPKHENILYVGTDLGVYVSVNGGASWQSLCNSLPTTPVHDLFVHPRDDELVIGTHGRSVFVLDVTPIRDFGKKNHSK